MEKKISIQEYADKQAKVQEVIKENQSSLSNQLTGQMLENIDNEINTLGLVDLSSNELSKLIEKEKGKEISVLNDSYVVEKALPDDMPLVEALRFKSINAEQIDPNEANFILYHNKVFSNGSTKKEAVALMPNKYQGTEEVKNKETIMFTGALLESDKKNDVESVYLLLGLNYVSKEGELLLVKKHKDGKLEKLSLPFDSKGSEFSFYHSPNPSNVVSVQNNKPRILDKSEALSSIRKINEVYGAWRVSEDFNNLPDQSKKEISNSEFLKKICDYIYRGNVAGVSALLKQNQDKQVNLDNINSYILNMAVSGGNQQMIKALIANGADPRGINLDNITSPELREYLKQEAHKRNHPIKSALGIKAT